jgi:hypothetical protein
VLHPRGVLHLFCTWTGGFEWIERFERLISGLNVDDSRIGQSEPHPLRQTRLDHHGSIRQRERAKDQQQLCQSAIEKVVGR